MALSYQEILARREKRRADEIAFAMRRPPVPSNHGVATQILILQWMIDELYKTWRASEIAKAQPRKEVIKPQSAPRGGRKANKVFEILGIS